MNKTPINKTTKCHLALAKLKGLILLLRSFKFEFIKNGIGNPRRASVKLNSHEGVENEDTMQPQLIHRSPEYASPAKNSAFAGVAKPKK